MFDLTCTEGSTSITGDNVHVTAYNVMLYLDIIERRINDLMNVVHCLEKNVPRVQTHIGEDQFGNPHPPLIDKVVPPLPITL